MPITVGAPLRAMDEEEFKAVVYATMRHVFAVHNDMGRLFDEKIYQREIARRVANAACEVPVTVSFEDFSKTYYLDLLVEAGAVFEFKAVETLSERHRGQLLNYLFLTGLPHGKLVSMRPDRVQHEFVNAPPRYEDRTAFAVDADEWSDIDGSSLLEKMVALLRDWGTGLDLGLYQEAASHFCGRAAMPEAPVEISMDGASLGMQLVRLASAESALHVTCLPDERRADIATHLRQFLARTPLRSLHWINITRPLVTFCTLTQ